MAKYIKCLFYILAVIFVINVVHATTQQKFDELEQAASVVPTSIETIRDKQRQLACMTQNVYWEAASEPAEGKIAVAQVVMNRVASGQFGSTPCQVIHQRSLVYEKVICQFSWACDRIATSKPVRQDLWRESQEAAKMVLIEGFRLPSIEGALYYHADYVNPNWGKKRKAQIGRHIFY